MHFLDIFTFDILAKINQVETYLQRSTVDFRVKLLEVRPIQAEFRDDLETVVAVDTRVTDAFRLRFRFGLVRISVHKR